MTDIDPDLAPDGDAFAAAYELPEGFPDSLRELHTEILNRMRNESRAVPMNTVQRMLVERIAYFYVAMKHRETQAEVSFSLKEQKEMLDFWLKMTVEFNRLLSTSQDKARTTLLVEVQNVLRNSLKKVPDAELRQALALEWNNEFARIDA